MRTSVAVAITLASFTQGFAQLAQPATRPPASAPAAGALAPKSPPASAPTATAPAGLVVLSEGSFWRKHYTFFPGKVSVRSAEAAGVPTGADSRAKHIAGVFPSGFVSDPPPEGWQKGDFDDSVWLIQRGRQFICGDGRLMPAGQPDATSVYLRGGDPFLVGVGLLCQRGAFVVKDRGKVKSLSLSVTYRGGFAAYLNGKEFARQSLPEGKLSADTAGEDYPLETHFYAAGEKKGKYLDAFDKAAPWQLRERSCQLAVPVELLVDGRNVLAIEFHRSDYPVECAKVKSEFGWQRMPCMAGLSLLNLQADAEAVEPASMGRKGFVAWTADSTREVSDNAWPTCYERLGPLRLAGCRNGSFSGLVMLAADKPLEGVSAKAAELLAGDGKGRIPSDAITIRYLHKSPFWSGGMNWSGATVSQEPPKPLNLGNRLDVPMGQPPKDALSLGLLVSVQVPADAPAGLYKGQVTVNVAGRESVQAPIELAVADWTLPPPARYGGKMNIYQSPETLAEQYRVQPWSQEHWKLIEGSLKLMGQAGNVGLFLPLLAQSQRGNADSYVTWIPEGQMPSTAATAKAGQTYKYDFSIFDRYLDAAMKHHDPERLFFVCLVIWGYEGDKAAGQTLVSVRDPKTGQKSLLSLPMYGASDCEQLLRPLLLACQERLKQRGLAKKLLIGMAWDVAPKVETVAMFREILPEAGWLTESHMRQWSYPHDAKDPKNKLVPVKYNSVVWGGAVPDPQVNRYHGWNHGPDRLMMNYNRVGVDCLSLTGFPPPWSYRMWMESTLTCDIGRNGNGNVGGDYWPIARGLISQGRYGGSADWNGGGTLYGIYPRSNVGRTGVGNNTVDLFAPGPEGAIPTLRFLIAREGNQEAEARVFVERALLDKKDPLPEELARTAWAVLDERIMYLRMWQYNAAGVAAYQWQERDRKLFELAGAVGKALQARQPAQ